MSDGGAKRDRSTWLRAVGIAFLTAGCVVASWLYDRGLLDAFQLPKRAAFVVGGLTVAAFLVGHAAWKKSLALPKEALLLVTFLALAITGVFWAHAPEQAAAPLRDVAAAAAWWLIGVLLLRRDRDLVPVLIGLAVAGTVMGRIGVLQADALQSGAQITLETVPETRWVMETFDLSPPTKRPTWFENLPASPDPPGAMAGHVNVAAETVLLGMIAALGLLVLAVEALRRRVTGRIAVGVFAFLLLPVALVVQGAFLITAGSRAAWLAGTLALAWLGFCEVRRLNNVRVRRWTMIGAAAAILVIAIAVPLIAPHVEVTGRGGAGTVKLSDRLAEAFDWSGGTERERQTLWGNTLGMIGDHPWLGVGAGNWKIEYPKWAKSFAAHSSDDFSPIRQPERAHNDALQVLAETGWPAFLCLVGFFIVGGMRITRPQRGDHRMLARDVAASAILAVLVLSMVAFPFQLPYTASMAFLLLGAGANDGRRKHWFEVRPPTALGVAAVLAVLAVLSAFDLNGRLKADGQYWLARYDQRAASIAVADRGAVRRMTGRDLMQRALDRLDDATARDPSSYLYQIKRAEVLWELGLGDDAFAALDRVLELHPNLIQAMLLKAELHNRLGRQEDLAAAWELIHVRARRIMPWSPEVHFAAGQHLMMMAERFPEHSGFYRGQAIEQFKVAADPEVREYAPMARLSLVAAMLDRGDPLPEVIRWLGYAERDASTSPALLAHCARLYADPRLAAFGGGVFGPAGHKTQAIWKKVLALTRDQHAEARMETMLEPWHAWKANGRQGKPPDLEPMEAWLRAHLVANPQVVLPRYYLALMLEDLGRMGQASGEWANLGRYVQRGGRLSTFWKRKIEFEIQEFGRRLKKAPRSGADQEPASKTNK